MQKATKNDTRASRITDNWAYSSKQLQKKYAHLTEEDLKFESGQENDMLRRMEKKLGMNRAEVIAIIKGAQNND